MMSRMPRSRLLVRSQPRDYGKGLERTNLMVDPAVWAEYQAMCAELGITASAGLRQLMKRAVKGYKANG